MIQKQIQVEQKKIPVYLVDAAVIGSGCAGFNAADWLFALGVENVVLVTEGIKMGTSRNTGSDKQTYYKLSISGNADSVSDMAADLFAGGGVNGDTALAEAANSTRCFLKLANLGVPFPTDAYGQYVGYKTDHDPRQRASSAGPLTSRFMTEVLEKAVKQKNIPILDRLTAIRLLTEDQTVKGVLCIDQQGNPVVLCCGCVVLATGGPASCYADVVYPHSQTGMSGLALEAGAEAANLNEWQYGLASIKFRWNVSGTYQQVLPRYFSVDQDGVEREFLLSYFASPGTALDMEFLKGYQWPFDSEKRTGSSLIDIAVYHERVVLKRRVYMDFRREPTGLEEDFSVLGTEAYQYLQRSNALCKTPIARLEKMNPAAIALYRGHGIDLYTEPLEIAVCAQHHNGGIAVDANWQSSVGGLYVVGEAAGTFGPRRPGGSALNSAQVGALRASEHIAWTLRPNAQVDASFDALAASAVSTYLRQTAQALQNRTAEHSVAQKKRLQRIMSDCAAYLRDIPKIRSFRTELDQLFSNFFSQIRIDTLPQAISLYKTRDMIITQLAVLSAMEYAASAFGTRGGSLVLKPDGESLAVPLEQYRIAPPILPTKNVWLSTKLTSEGFESRLLPVRAIPQPDDWFENVWAEYRTRRG